MTQLQHHPNAWVRSKAALLVGRSKKNHKWVEQRMGESDSRVRANALESLWGIDSDGCRKVFLAAAADSDNRVVGNALLGLYRLGEACSVPLIAGLLTRAEPLFRMTGLWVMGQTGDARFRDLISGFSNDPEPKIQDGAVRAMAKLEEALAQDPPQGQVRVSLSRLSSHSGWIHTSAVVSAQDPNGQLRQAIPGLRATRFVLYENSNLVTEYEVRENSRPETLALAFVAPRTVENSDEFYQNYEAAFRQAMAHKRKNDAWLILKYLSGKDANLTERPTPPGGVERVRLPVDTHFHTGREPLMTAVTAAGNRLALPENFWIAINSLIPSVALMHGSRHIVLIQDPGAIDFCPGPCQELARSAKSARTAIHVIGLNAGPMLLDLVRRTDGSFIRLDRVDELPNALEVFCAALINHYAIRFRAPSNAPAAAASDLKVQVYTPAGMAETVSRRCLNGAFPPFVPGTTEVPGGVSAHR